MLSVIVWIIFVLSAVLLVLVVLIQDDQGEGIGGMFTGGGATPFGSRSGNVLTRTTTILAVVFFLSAFGLAFLNRSTAEDNLLEVSRQEQSSGNQFLDWWDQPVTPAADVPADASATVPGSETSSVVAPDAASDAAAAASSVTASTDAAAAGSVPTSN